MRRLAVIGYPIKHSLSPAMHQAALRAAGIPGTYSMVEVPPSDLGAFVSGLRDGGWIGINVTVPHKEAIIPLLDEVSPAAAEIGAVNTLVVKDGRLAGHNTDAAGFLRSLTEDAGFDPAGQSAAVLGAGGAARAVVWSLVRNGARSVAVVNRSPERAAALVAAARDWGDSDLTWHPRDEASMPDYLAGCALVVNTTSVGLRHGDTPVRAEILPEGALVVDIVYNPRPTRFLAEAAGRGLRTLDGLPMLVYQGAAAFELWTGQRARADLMRAAAEAALGGVG